MHAETHPGLSMGEYSKKMGELWKELSEGDKKPYHVRGERGGGVQ